MVMNIRVLTPDRVICSTTADEVVLPGLTGQVGVLDGHATLITALDTGLLRIKLEEKWTPIILCGGLAEIDRNRVTVLVNDVEELMGVELSEATQELEKATLAVEEAEKGKSLLDASVELKKATAATDIDLEFGDIKLKLGGGDAGHKGVRSISQHLGTKDFNRIRMGIGRPSTKEEVSSFVLSNFSKTEVDKTLTLIQNLCENFEKIIQK